jgi:chromosome segregation protein
VHLKRLQLTGFKTFADRTEILFSPGVTAIVGPNGSGKSNIADAVLWVLGEQKASAVRGVRNQDVIFNGSAKRKQTGLAEVSLTVDNSDGSLPLSFDEVTITRRALRSGESEYFINKAACRLKDIYELFLDTGVGREAYALVNQSEIDAVLTAAPESRRGLFEEAAGIKKYRVKKREALRKLEATELNLSRITDILTEVESQLTPLHIQSQLARRYLLIKEELTRVEENYLITELRTADQQLNTARLGRQSDEQLALEFAEKLAVSEEGFALVAGAAAEAESALESFRRRHEAIRSKNERLHNERRLSAERVQALKVQAELHQRELDDLLSRLEGAIAQVASLVSEADQTGQQSGDRQRVQSDGEDRLRRLNEEIRRLEQLIEKRRREADALARRRASEEGEAARAEARLSEAQATVALLQEERHRLSSDTSSLRQACVAAEEHIVKAESDAAGSAAKAAELKDSRTASQENATKVRLEHEQVRGEGLSISVRLKSLLGLEESQEGYFAGVKSVISASRSGKLPGRFLVVADSFKAPEHLVTALDTAFGSSLQDIITDTESEAKAAIAYLKQGSHGRATFLPLQRMKGARADIRHTQGRPQRGFLGAAIDLIEFDSELRPALESLVGRVLIAETLDDGISLSANSSGWSRIVTLAGEVLTPSGSITGGSNQRRGNSLLERKSEIQKLTNLLAEQKQDEDSAAKRLVEAIEAQNNAEARLRTGADEAAEQRLRVSGAKQQAERANRDLAAASDRADAHNRRLETAMESVRLAGVRVNTCRSILTTLDDVPEGTDSGNEAETLKVLNTERESINSEITQERISRAALDEKTVGLSRALRLAKADVEQMSVQKERRLVQIAQVEQDQNTLSEQIESMAAVIVASDVEVEKSNETLSHLQSERHKLSNEANSASEVIRDLQNGRATALSAARKNELAETRFEIVRQQAALKLLEEYDITAEHALSLESNPKIAADGPREVARLRRELRNIGEVNVAAVEEFDRLSERFAYMTAQKNDAQIAKDKVYEAIREIDESTRDVFMSTFHAVQIAFQSVFERLFNGGAASLKLTEPSDLLETGIEIFVQLPGKKQQNLQLLSGGERALTAVALLFAFLKVKPAPFCLLDEVDAPLDGANIERFADLLREFGHTMQFLVITHNPATMEAAYVWYGVTMQEPGISRVLSLQVPEPFITAIEERQTVLS